MRQDKIEQYLASKGINASYGTLGSTYSLINLFVKENAQTIRETSHRKSNYIKHQLYSKYYEFEERPKFTGFEKFVELDNKFRVDNAAVGRGLLGAPYIQVATGVTEDATATLIATPSLLPGVEVEGSYLEELKSTLKTYSNPLLYLSGGLDSEFVARAMLDAGIQFKTVIFRLTDKNHDVLNAQDILYALDFCEEYGLNPIIKNICIPKLWASAEFAEIAKGTETNSPQMNTHAYMAEVMSVGFPDATHIFGGEVRILTQVDMSADSTLSIVNAVKVASPGYVGVTYSLVYYSATPYVGALTISLNYNWDGVATNDQAWNITTTPPYYLSGTPGSGNWYDAGISTAGIEYSYGPDSSSYWNWNTLGTPTTYFISGLSTNGRGYSAYGSGVIDCPLYIRSAGNPATQIYTPITCQIGYSYTGPAVTTLLSFHTPGEYLYINSLGYGAVTATAIGAGGAGAATLDDGFTGFFYGGGGAGGSALGVSATLPFGASIHSFVGAGGTNPDNVSYTNGSPTTIDIASGSWYISAPGGNTAHTSTGAAHTPFSGGLPGTYSAGGGAGYLGSGVNGTTFGGGNGGAGTSYTQSGYTFYEGGGGGGGGYSTGGTNTLYGTGGGATSGSSGSFAGGAGGYGVVGVIGIAGAAGGGAAGFDGGGGFSTQPGGQGGPGAIILVLIG